MSFIYTILQATYAILDQVLHSGPIENTLLPYAKSTHESDGLWPASSKLLSDIQCKVGLSDWSSCSPAHLGAWPHRFTHLVNYGGRYYAYLMAKAGANLVWRRYFSKDPWCSSSGQVNFCELFNLTSFYIIVVSFDQTKTNECGRIF